jgi:hypothetical protein
VSLYHSGVPRSDEQIGLLLSERPDYWEYFLFAGALVVGLERLQEKYSDYALGYAPRLGLVVPSGEFMHFLDSQLNEFGEMIGLLDKLLSEDVMAEALGPPGVAGEPEKIFHAASRVIRLYEDMLSWAERIRGMSMPKEYRHVAELLVRFSEQPINELRDFVLRFSTRIDELASLSAEGEEVEITERVWFNIPRPLMLEFKAARGSLSRQSSDG